MHRLPRFFQRLPRSLLRCYELAMLGILLAGAAAALLPAWDAQDEADASLQCGQAHISAEVIAR